MKPVASVLQFVLLSAGVSACGSSGTVGACYVDYQTPVFEVRTAANTSTSSAIPQIRFSNFTLTRDGAVITQDIRSQAISGVRHGVTIPTDGTKELICDVSCGFGTDPGHYSMTVSAPGFAPKQLEYDVNFAAKGGGSNGCPLILSGPTKVDISLTPTA